MDAHGGERKQVKVRKENSNEPGRVAFWWLRRSSPRDDEVWERLRNSNVDMESAGARMLWITRSISCENGEKFAGYEARRRKKVSPFDSSVLTSLASAERCDHFYACHCCEIDSMNSWWAPRDEWFSDRRVTCKGTSIPLHLNIRSYYTSVINILSTRNHERSNLGTWYISTTW